MTTAMLEPIKLSSQWPKSKAVQQANHLEPMTQKENTKVTYLSPWLRILSSGPWADLLYFLLLLLFFLFQATVLVLLVFFIRFYLWVIGSRLFCLFHFWAIGSNIAD